MQAASPRIKTPSPAARLKAKAGYFFGTQARSRAEVASFVEALSGLGPVMAIGGLLRDLALAGNRSFDSDVDLVVDPVSMAEFERFARRHGAAPNRFGGHGISLEHWKVDVWPLGRTWAAVNGHVAVETHHDLLGTTFFDWDAILYNPLERRLIHRPCYFARLGERALAVNLAPNPNPVGNAVRAIRHAVRWDARLGPALTEHVARQVRDNGRDALVAAERAGFRVPVLGTRAGVDAMDRLAGQASAAAMSRSAM